MKLVDKPRVYLGTSLDFSGRKGTIFRYILLINSLLDYKGGKRVCFPLRVDVS